MQKVFSAPVILVAVLVIAGIVGAAWYFNKIPTPKTQQAIPGIQNVTNPTPAIIDKIANWKTYTSTKYKYQFQYPSTWEQTISECTGSDRSDCLDFYEFSANNNKVSFEVYLGTWYPGTPLSEIKAGGAYDYHGGYHFLKSAVYNNIPMTIQVSNMANSKNNDGSYPTFIIVADFLSIDKTERFTLSFNWPANSITAKPTQKEVQQNLIRLDKILSTFIFIQ